MIPGAVEFALDRLHEAGFHAYVVGGCVRDFIMGRAPGDYDVTTSAKPEETLAVFSDCRVVETGLKHGTVTLVRDGMNIEITTYRIDGAYLDGRHPEKVTFTDDLAEDLCRRDFTVNAMAYSPESGVIDLHGGVEDVQNHVISCVGSAEKRFSEDGLRILRALRFSSVLDFTPDEACDAAVRRLTLLLDLISRERIYAELTKLLCGAAAPRILRRYPEVIARILPGLDEALVEQSADIMEKSREFVRSSGIDFTKNDVAAVNYALLFSGLTGNQCREAMRSLKPSREELRSVEMLQKYGNTKPNGAENAYEVKLLMKEGGQDFPTKVAVYKNAVSEIDETAAAKLIETAQNLAASGACVSLGELKLDGRDLMPMGFSGRQIGAALDALLDRVMRDELENDAEALKSAAERIRDEIIAR